MHYDSKNIVIGELIGLHVEVDYTRYIYKFERYLRKRSHIPAHNPECMGVKQGDTVEIAETRRLSKTKSFVVTNVIKQG